MLAPSVASVPSWSGCDRGRADIIDLCRTRPGPFNRSRPIEGPNTSQTLRLAAHHGLMAATQFSLISSFAK
jgi:hypothetical protein